MREFTDFKQNSGLKKFLDSQLGTLYFMSDASGLPQLMVRHFDHDLPTAWVEPYSDLIRATQRWIERHPELARLVRIDLPIEVGRDFVMRTYRIYYTSTDAYTDWEDPPAPPEELGQMRAAFHAAIGKSADPKDAIVERVLARSLLDPTGKTYFDEIEGKFVVVEPKLTREDVEHWVARSASANN